ncbi:anti-anti-sigma factor [Sediminihabitans luteus]|uniref:Anti-anti-sigma factor n=1 Tax=Sediminihabitans luteus TaxID=1138585 RepID=A0A2M9CZ02_9CELL|nr:STAS domain-containing protein [Sediminihabitans luteus]PJJ77127.1 anti-anti-sigma factor [Sediminihabitans luteus]GII98575.1 hypothetical protein Slu03_09530 [Sediminihabitans luteus]
MTAKAQTQPQTQAPTQTRTQARNESRTRTVWPRRRVHALHLDPGARTAVPQGTRLHDLAVDGHLDATAVLRLRLPVLDALQDGPAVVLVDVSAVDRIAPSGVAGMLDLVRLARSRGGDLRLHGRSAAIEHAHRTVRLDAVVRTYAGREEALGVARA